MRYKWMFMSQRNANRAKPVKKSASGGNNYGLKFNDDRYAIATPAFWEAWHANGKKVGNYMPARVPASAIGLSGNRMVWIVFVNGDLRRGFLDKLCIDGKMEWGQR